MSSNNPLKEIVNSQTCNKSERFTALKIDGKINGINAKLCIDTGASCTLVHQRFVQEKDIFPVKGVALITANKEELKISGKTRLHLDILGHSIYCNAIVSNSTSNNLLLGNDFNQKFIKQIDFEGNKAVFNIRGFTQKIDFQVACPTYQNGSGVITSVENQNKNITGTDILTKQITVEPRATPVQTQQIPESCAENKSTGQSQNNVNLRPEMDTLENVNNPSVVETNENSFSSNTNDVFQEEVNKLNSIFDGIDDTHDRLPVKLLCDENIPPLSEKSIRCRVKNFNEHEFGLLELSDGMIETKKLFSTNLVTDVAKVIKIKVINRNKNPVKLFKGSTFGSVIPIEVAYQEVGEEEISKLEEENAKAPETSTSNLDKNKLQEIEINKKLDRETINRIKRLIVKYFDIFIWKDTEFKAAGARCEAQDFELTDDIPVYRPPFRTGSEQRKIIRLYIEKMLRENVIRPCSSAYSSPLMLVKKKEHGAWRPVIDFRKINFKIKQERWPMMRVDDVITSLAGSAVYSIFDVHDAYFQIPLSEKAAQYTSFATFDNQYVFNCLPQGLSISGLRFIRILNNIFRPMLYRKLLLYCDDCVLFANSISELIDRMEEFFKLCREANIKLKAKKTKIGMEEIDVLGFKVSAEGIKPNPEKIENLQNVAPPTDVRGVRSFVSAAKFYSAHVKNMATLCAPLIDLTRKNAKFEWGADQQRAFQAIKDALTSAPCLAHYDPENASLELCTDASSLGISAVLHQRYKNGEIRPLGFMSRKLSESERAWSTPERELLAVTYGLDKFRPFLFNTKFKIFCDNQALSYVKTMETPTMRLAKLALKLSEFTYDIVHIPGKQNVVPDFLSRYPGEEKICAIMQIEQETDTNEEFTHPDLAKLQKEDLKLHKIFKELEKSKIYGTNSKTSRSYYVEGDILYKKVLSNRKIPVIPECLKSNVMYLLHDHHLFGGHLGVTKTLKKIKQRVFWTKMDSEIRQKVLSCETCQFMKKGINHEKYGKLISRKIAGTLWDQCAVDAFGPLNIGLDAEGTKKKFVLGAVDLFSKAVYLKSVSNIKAPTVAAFLTELFGLHGVSSKIIFDNGKNFDSTYLKNFLSQLGVKPEYIAPFTPRQNSQIEKIWSTVGNILRSYSDANLKNWPEIIPTIMGSYNSSVQESLGVSPQFVMTGQELRTPIDVKFRPKCDNMEIMERIARLDRAREEVKFNIKNAQRKQMSYANKNRQDSPYKVSDWVLIKAQPRSDATHSRKLRPKYRGPFQIIDEMSPGTYKLATTKRGPKKYEIVPADKLKKYVEKNPT